MRLRAIGRTGLLLLLSIFTAAPVRADLEIPSADLLAGDSDQSPIPRGFVVGGVLIGSTPRYQAQETPKFAIPGFVYFGKQFMYLGDRGRYYFHRDGNTAAFAYGRVRPGNLDPADYPEWNGMQQRKGQLEAGVGANVITPYALLTTRVATDISGRSKGGEMLLWSDFPIVRSNLLLMPGLGMLWRNSNLANYYFGGVAQDEAAPGRPAYDVGNSLSLMASLVSSYRFNKQWLGMVLVGYEHYSSGIKNSPLVQHSGETTLVTGVGYVW